MDQDSDIIIIGAGEWSRYLRLSNSLKQSRNSGISGIAAARFYLDIHPDAKLVLVEQDSCIGGAWSKSTHYDF